MENAYELYFHRLFSINPYRALRMKLCEMSLHKDWPHTDRGNPYPVVRESGWALDERVEDERLVVSAGAPSVDSEEIGANGQAISSADSHVFGSEESGADDRDTASAGALSFDSEESGTDGRNTASAGFLGERARRIGRFFPYATSEVCVDELDGEGARVGLEFSARSGHGSPYTPEDAPTLCVFLERAGAEVRVCHEEFVGGRSLGVVRHEALEDAGSGGVKTGRRKACAATAPGNASAVGDADAGRREACAAAVPGSASGIGGAKVVRHEMRTPAEMGSASGGAETGRRETFAFRPGDTLLVSAHGVFFDVSLAGRFVCTIQADGFSEICRRGAFMNAGVSLYVGLPAGGRAVVSRAESFLDGGISHADIKPVRYEDGTPIVENGRLFLTLSSRLQAGAYQFVASWNPSTCELKPEGAIFFDYGNGFWCADVAISLLYHRERREWLFWATAFSHGHILCHGTSAGDPRFGITVLDATLMAAQRTGEAADDALSVQAGGRGAGVAELDDDTLWLAKTGDEDPDFTYDRARGKWYMTICRSVRGEGYRYFLFESDEPFSGYRHVCHTETGENTGGLMVCIRGRRALVCGSDFKARAEYRVYPLGDFSHYERLTCDFDDGGFRGWGSLMPVPCGNRTKYVWMTFDRHNGSDFNWSYGNLYAYEAEEMDSQ